MRPTDDHQLKKRDSTATLSAGEHRSDVAVLLFERRRGASFEVEEMGKKGSGRAAFYFKKRSAVPCIGRAPLTEWQGSGLGWAKLM